MPFCTARLEPLLKTSSRAGRRIGIAAALVVFATQGLQDAAADGETRTLTIHHTHTREDITVTFKRNGRYDDSGLAKLNAFLRDWRNDEKTTMDPRLFDIVWEVYQEVGAREPIQIISAYRSPHTNAMLRRRSRGVAQFSQHMVGKAMDFNIPGVSLEKVRVAGLRLQRGGVGFYPSSGSPFVHLDVGSIRHWPRMTHDQLARVFPDGRTVHVPSDGRPLSGYALALADVARRGATPSHVSLAAARGAGIQTADAGAAGDKPKRGWFARLFSGGTDEEDDKEERAAPARSRVKAPEPPAAKPAQVAMANVPMPRPRPAARDAAPALVASRAKPTPAQVVMARGFWQGSDAIAAADAVTATAKVSGGGERLVWRVGAQPVTTSGDSTTIAKRAPAPRPRPEIALAAAETTASLPWPVGTREDRVPSDLMLAYAATPSAAETPPQPAALSAPMGSLRPSPATARNAGPRRAQAATLPSPLPTGALSENPWLRGVIAAPSVYASMDVSVLGAPNYRELARLMHKPPSAVANAFANDADFGLDVATFSGPAVAFVPTVAFGTITAGLN